MRREPLVWVTSARHNVHKSATLPLALGSPHCVWRKTAIDMPAANELVAHNRDEAEIAEYIGADWLLYQNIDDLKQSAWEGNSGVDNFECSTFDGKYVTGDIDDSYLTKVSLARNDKSKEHREAQLKSDSNVLELHNHA